MIGTCPNKSSRDLLVIPHKELVTRRSSSLGIVSKYCWPLQIIGNFLKNYHKIVTEMLLKMYLLHSQFDFSTKTWTMWATNKQSSYTKIWRASKDDTRALRMKATWATTFGFLDMKQIYSTKAKDSIQTHFFFYRFVTFYLRKWPIIEEKKSSNFSPLIIPRKIVREMRHTLQE